MGDVLSLCETIRCVGADFAPSGRPPQCPAGRIPGLFSATSRALTAARKALILGTDLRPGASSTPDETSTAGAPERATASATFSGASPPASIQGSGQAVPARIRQSKVTALPPGRAPAMVAGGLASKIGRAHV